MRGNTKPIYAVEEPATGLYFNLEGEQPRVVPLAEASRYPSRLSACTRITATLAPGAYELVRVQS